MGKIWKMLVMIFALIIMDQITKGVIQSKFYHGESIPVLDGFFNFTYVRNPGAAFGFMANAHDSIRKPLFLLIPLIACGWIMTLMWKVRNTNNILLMSYSLILAGAIGNLIDRFSLGYVVDFFDFYVGNAHFPAFNIADSCITIAAFLLILDFFLEIKNRKKEILSDQPAAKDNLVQ